MTSEKASVELRGARNDDHRQERQERDQKMAGCALKKTQPRNARNRTKSTRKTRQPTDKAQRRPLLHNEPYKKEPGDGRLQDPRQTRTNTTRKKMHSHDAADLLLTQALTGLGEASEAPQKWLARFPCEVSS